MLTTRQQIALLEFLLTHELADTRRGDPWLRGARTPPFRSTTWEGRPVTIGEATARALVAKRLLESRKAHAYRVTAKGAEVARRLRDGA